MKALERGVRTSPASPLFIEADKKLRDSALASVKEAAPANVDPKRFVDEAAQVAAARTEVAQRSVDKAAGAQRGVDIAMEKPAASVDMMRGQGAGASKTIDETVRATRDAELAQSRQLYNAPEIAVAQVPEKPIRDVADAIKAQGTARAPNDPVVQKYVDRFATQLDKDGNPVPNPQPFTMAEVNKNIADVEADIQANLANGGVVRQLKEVKDALTSYAAGLAEQGGPAGTAVAAARGKTTRPAWLRTSGREPAASSTPC